MLNEGRRSPDAVGYYLATGRNYPVSSPEEFAQLRLKFIDPIQSEYDNLTRPAAPDGRGEALNPALQ